MIRTQDGCLRVQSGAWLQLAQTLLRGELPVMLSPEPEVSSSLSSPLSLPSEDRHWHLRTSNYSHPHNHKQTTCCVGAPAPPPAAAPRVVYSLAWPGDDDVDLGGSCSQPLSRRCHAEPTELSAVHDHQLVPEPQLPVPGFAVSKVTNSSCFLT